MTHKTIGQLILTDFEAARPMLEAWALGEKLAYKNGLHWPLVGTSSLDREVTYRILPRPHHVDWSQVGERIVGFKTTEDGRHWAIDKSGLNWVTDLWPSFRPGTMPWEQSRIERPKEVK